MFSTFLGEAKNYLGRSLILAVWMPVFMMGIAFSTTILTARDKLNWSLWQNLDNDFKPVVGFSLLVAITSISFLLHHLQVPIARFFEGYWPDYPPFRRLKKKQKSKYARRFSELQKTIERLESAPVKDSANLARKINTFLCQYPPLSIDSIIGYSPDVYIMPTQFGNIYRSAELYSLARYGLDAVVFWPHLIEVIPEGFSKRLQDLKIAVDFWLLCALLLIVYFVSTLTVLVIVRASPFFFLFPLLSLPLSYACYVAALTPALAYGTLIRAAFDLYRRLLLKKLGCILPTTLDEEREIWQSLQHFMYNGAPMSENMRFSEEA